MFIKFDLLMVSAINYFYKSQKSSCKILVWKVKLFELNNDKYPEIKSLQQKNGQRSVMHT